MHDRALAELRAGRKQGHWIWYVLPQLRGLGRSATSQEYGLRGLEEAAAYAAHPVLGPRLVTCARALLDLPEGTTAEQVVAHDAVKLHSSMTVFSLVEGADPVFAAVLDRYFAGEPDAGTLRLLGRSSARP